MFDPFYRSHEGRISELCFRVAAPTTRDFWCLHAFLFYGTRRILISFLFFMMPLVCSVYVHKSCTYRGYCNFSCGFGSWCCFLCIRVDRGASAPLVVVQSKESCSSVDQGCLEPAMPRRLIRIQMHSSGHRKLMCAKGHLFGSIGNVPAPIVRHTKRETGWLPESMWIIMV